MSEFPLYTPSLTKPNEEVFVFRDTGQQIRVNINGNQPKGELKLTPEERTHILEHFYKKL